MFSLFGSSGTESPSASPQGEIRRVVSFVQAVCCENCEMMMPRLARGEEEDDDDEKGYKHNVLIECQYIEWVGGSRSLGGKGN